MRKRSLSPALIVGAALALSTLAPRRADAGGAVLGETSREVTPVAVRVATSSDGTRSTRWQSVVVPAGERVAWLVPAKPGAKVDFAGEAFFAALDSATTVRVERPEGGAGCGQPGDLATVHDSVPQERATREPGAPFVLRDAAELQRFASENGFVVPSHLEGRAFRDGFSLVALVFQAGARPVTTPVVRVSDDGPPVLPLVLTRGANARVPVTAWVISDGPAQVGTRVPLDSSTVVWGPEGTTYFEAREAALSTYRGFGFVTEAAGHSLTLGPLPPAPDGSKLSTLAELFASRVAKTTPESDRCADALARLTNAPLRFGIACAPGALVTVPGGDVPACDESNGDADVTRATCDTPENDLAIAFSGKRADRVAVTRAHGFVALGEYGGLVGFSDGPAKDPILTAGKLSSSCGASPTPFTPTPGPTGAPGGGSYGTGSAGRDGEVVRYETSSCSGNTVAIYDTSSDSTYASDTSDDSCGGSSSSSSDGSDSSSDDTGCGGDTVGGDNDGSSSDSCSSDSSSSDSSDSCSSDSGSSSDSCKADSKSSHRRGKKSPMSRAAFLIVALALPMRRLFKKRSSV